MTQSRRKSNRKRLLSNRNAMAVIIGLFVLSALTRLGGEAGIAIAREFETLQGALSEPDLCIPTDGLGELVDALTTREEIIEQKEDEIASRMAALMVAEKVYSDNIQSLIAAEKSLEATIARANTAAEDDINRLTTLYENMKPVDAARLFEQMDPEFSAGFIIRMHPETAANIMASLPAQTAYAISVIVAGRNADVPRE